MRFALYTTALSAHQLPVYRLMRDKLGAENCRYICGSRDGVSAQTRLGEVDVEWMEASDAAAQDWLEDADVLYVGGVRPLDLFERRTMRGLKTLFQSERWFKPLVLFDLRLFDCLISLSLPGWMRMWVPGYRRMVKRFVRWANGDPNARVLAIGPWAKKDFLRMGVKPEKIEDWGYFVEKGTGIRDQGSGFDESNNRKSNNQTILKILWVGRDLAWKRVDTIIRAANEFKVQGLKFKVTLVGDGPEKQRLIKLAQRLFPADVAIQESNNLKSNNRTIVFLPSLPIKRIREIMQSHDVYVLASDANEGWGAALNEAFEEGMNALGTFEAGASAAMLPRDRLYHAGDYKALARLLVIEYEDRGHGQKMLPPCSIGDWTAASAAERLLKLVR